MSKQAQTRSRSRPAKYMEENEPKTPQKSKVEKKPLDKTETKTEKAAKNKPSQVKQTNKSKDQKMRDISKSPMRAKEVTPIKTD